MDKIIRHKGGCARKKMPVGVCKWHREEGHRMGRTGEVELARSSTAWGQCRGGWIWSEGQVCCQSRGGHRISWGLVTYLMGPLRFPVLPILPWVAFILLSPKISFPSPLEFPLSLFCPPFPGGGNLAYLGHFPYVWMSFQYLCTSSHPSWNSYER